MNDRRFRLVAHPRRLKTTFRRTTSHLRRSLGVLGRVCLLLAAVAAGCGEVSLPVTEPGDIVIDDVFEVTVTLRPSGPQPGPIGADLPSEHRFVLQLREATSPGQALLGIPGETVTIFLNMNSEGARVAASPFNLAATDLADVLCQTNQVQYNNMRLVPIDRDGNGMADGLEGIATGEVTVFTPDGLPLVDVAFSADITAVLDRTPPQFTVVNTFSSGGADDPVPGDDPVDGPFISDVLDPIVVVANEPIRGPSNLVITANNGQQYPLTAENTGVSSAYAYIPGPALPFDSALRLESVGPLPTDLAGNVATTLPTLNVRTTPDPGRFAIDGFETGQDRIFLSGQASLVTAVGDIPAIGGQRSLFLPPGSSATLRMATDIDTAALRMRVRRLYSGEDTFHTATVGISDPLLADGVILPIIDFIDGVPGRLVQSADARWPLADSEPTVVEFPILLEPSLSDEVTVVIDNSALFAITCALDSGLTEGAILIDDIEPVSLFEFPEPTPLPNAH